MNNRPDESTLISYLYGELEGKDLERVEQYFQQHPQALAEWRATAAVRDILGNAQEKEVIAPPVMMEDTRPVRSLWSVSYFRMAVSIAASFLFIIVAGRLAGTEIHYSKGELKISFGGGRPAEVVQAIPEGMTSSRVQEIVDSSVNRKYELMAAQFDEQQIRLNKAVQRNLSDGSRKMDELVTQTAMASQQQLQGFVAGLKEENVQLMREYLLLSTADQKKYMENLLVDFSKYLQEQRNQDFVMYQTRMNNLERNTNQFQQETEQILTSIISNSNTREQKNNY